MIFCFLLRWMSCIQYWQSYILTCQTHLASSSWTANQTVPQVKDGAAFANIDISMSCVCSPLHLLSSLLTTCASSGRTTPISSDKRLLKKININVCVEPLLPTKAYIHARTLFCGKKGISQREAWKQEKGNYSGISHWNFEKWLTFFLSRPAVNIAVNKIDV